MTTVLQQAQANIAAFNAARAANPRLVKLASSTELGFNTIDSNPSHWLPSPDFENTLGPTGWSTGEIYNNRWFIEHDVIIVRQYLFGRVPA